MDATLSRIVDLAVGKDTRLACAAAVVLTELAPQERAVAQTLGGHLPKSDPACRPFLVEALGRIGTAEAAALLVPLIRGGGKPGEEALRAVAHARAGALKPLLQELKGAAPELLAKLGEAVARTGEAQGFGALLAEMRSATDDGLRALRRGLHGALPGLDERGRQALGRELAKALETPGFAKREEAVLAAIDLLGELGLRDALQILMAQAAERASLRVRGAALVALGKLDLDAERRGRLAERYFELLEDERLPQLVEPALMALKGAELGAAFRPRLQKLVNSARPELREFAMQALASQGSAKNLRDLVDRLEDPDRSVREDAAEALRRAPSASGQIAEKLVAMRDGEACRSAARILLPMADRIPSKVLEQLCEAYLESATGRTPEASSPDLQVRQHEDQRRNAILAVIRSARTPHLAALAVRESRRLRGKGEAHMSLALMKSVAGGEGWGPEQVLEHSLAGLSAQSLDLSRSARAANPYLRNLGEQLSQGFLKPETASRMLLKDDSIERRLLYFLGHHLAEQIHEERALGKLLLEELAHNPRSEEGKRAKEKLVLEGLSDGGRRGTGILEERAQILMAPADMAAKAAAEEALQERERQEAERARARKESLARKKAAASLREKVVVVAAKAATRKKAPGRLAKTKGKPAAKAAVKSPAKVARRK